MPPMLIIVEPPGFNRCLGLGERGEWCTFKHLSRRQPLKDSIQACSTGVPGRMKSSGTPQR